MSCDLCTYAQLILNKSVAFPHRGCKSRAERTTPIGITKHHCSGGDQHGCGGQPCHDHSALHRVWRFDRVGDIGPGRCCICDASYNRCAAMPDQPLHFPSEREAILKSRLHLLQLRCDLHDTALRSRETISQSLDLIAKVDEALAHTPFLVPPRH